VRRRRVQPRPDVQGGPVRLVRNRPDEVPLKSGRGSTRGRADGRLPTAGRWRRGVRRRVVSGSGVRRRLACERGTPWQLQ
jgi:hypothetical protein